MSSTTNTPSTLCQIESFLKEWQSQLCAMLETEDGSATFKQDPWQYHQGSGGGVSTILQNGSVLESAGVNFSHIHGKQLPNAASKHLQAQDCPFEAMGVSTVIHPNNPFVPTAHANLRFMTIKQHDGSPHWWFGGGFDLTPYYPFEEDCQLWHQHAKAACDPFGEQLYAPFKQQCDDYFYLPHRQEMRGIGGLFFDDLNGWEMEHCLAFIESVGQHFLQAYQIIIERRKSHAWTEQQKAFQCFRRGRYVEFNLLYDRGTHFGLQSGGRTESILMSLPKQVHWHYQTPEALAQDQNNLQPYLTPRPNLSTPKKTAPKAPLAIKKSD